MRGKACLSSCANCWCGITPAYAGKRYLGGIVLHVNWDHPRLCGEKFLRSVSALGTEGSPPPMRGKVFGKNTLLAHAGITPAYAGKSLKALIMCKIIWDHPRLCGEKRQI